MTTWVLAQEAVDDLEGLADFLLESLPDAVAATGEVILSALEYEYDARNDTALVLRIRHQRGLGYRTD